MEIHLIFFAGLRFCSVYSLAIFFKVEQSQTDVEDNLPAGAGGFCVPVIKW